jgi:hypothetical protein
MHAEIPKADTTIVANNARIHLILKRYSAWFYPRGGLPVPSQKIDGPRSDDPSHGSDPSAAYRPPSAVHPAHELAETDCEQTIVALRAHNNLILAASDNDRNKLLTGANSDYPARTRRRRVQRAGRNRL